MQYLAGDAHALEIRSTELRNLAASLSLAVLKLDAVLRDAQATDNSIGAAVAQWAAATKDQLSTYRDDINSVATALTNLATSLKLEDKPPPPAQPGYISYSHPFTPFPLTFNQHEARAAELRATGDHLISKYAPPEPSGLMRFLRNTGQFLKEDFIDPITGLATGLWGVTGEVLVDKQKWQDNVAEFGTGIADTYNAFTEHPGDSLHAVFDSIILKDQFEKDPQAATVSAVASIASLFVGVGEIKLILNGRKGLSAAADAAKSVRYLSDIKPGTAILTETSSVLAKFPEVAKRTIVVDKSSMTKWSETKNHFDRGNQFENDWVTYRIGENELWAQTYSNEKTIDTFIIDTSDNTLRVESVKTIDPDAKTYSADPNQFYRTLDKYAETAQRYEQPTAISGVKIPEDLEQHQSIVIGLPESGLTDAHAAKLNELVDKYSKPNEHGQMLDIMFVEAPR